MRKTAKRITSVIVTILIIAIIGGLFYLDWSIKSNKKKEADEKVLTEAGKLLERDLKTNYPETPKELAKYYSNITKVLFSGIEDDEVEALARKALELYDEEFLANNPEQIYFKDLYSEIAAWNDAGRTITNFLLVREDEEERWEQDGRAYANIYVSYYTLDDRKSSQTRNYLMRKDKEGKWKILGWKYILEED